jgi:hypothetical protein
MTRQRRAQARQRCVIWRTLLPPEAGRRDLTGFAWGAADPYVKNSREMKL